MSLKLEHLDVLPNGMTIDYQIVHSTPGAEGTTLREPMKLSIRSDKSWIELHITDCEGSTPNEALDRLAVWLRRLAEGIEQRTSITIPS